MINIVTSKIFLTSCILIIVYNPYNKISTMSEFDMWLLTGDRVYGQALSTVVIDQVHHS